MYTELVLLGCYLYCLNNPIFFAMLFNFTISTMAVRFSLGFLLYLICIIEEPSSYAFPLILGYFGLMEYHGMTQFLPWIIDHPDMTAYYVLGYFLCGLIWSMPKLKLYLRREDIQSELRRYLDNKVTGTPSLGSQEDIVKEFLKRNKMRISCWILYWPLSIIFTFTQDIVREVVNYGFGRMKIIYKKMVLNELKNMTSTNEEDINEEQPNNEEAVDDGEEDDDADSHTRLRRRIRRGS